MGQDVLAALPPDALVALLAHVSRLKHDLGKYVALQQRFLAEGADDEALRAALIADLRETRRGPAGTVDAPTVWAEFRGALVGDSLVDGQRVAIPHEPDVVAIDADMARLGAVNLDAAVNLHEIAAAARRVSEACRRLHARVRQAADLQAGITSPPGPRPGGRSG